MFYNKNSTSYSVWCDSLYTSKPNYMEGWTSALHFYQDTTTGKQCKGDYVYNYAPFNATALPSSFYGISSINTVSIYNVTRLEAYKVTFI